MIFAYTLLAVVLGLATSTFRQPWLAGALFLALVLAASSALDGAGYAKPAWTEWRPLDRELVLAADYAPERYIYVWVRTPEGPRAYRLPWSAETARRLQRALDEAAVGEGVIMVGRSVPGMEGTDYTFESPDTPTPEALRKDDGPEHSGGFLF